MSEITPSTMADMDDPAVSELFHENSKQCPTDSRMTDRIIAVSASPIMQLMMATALKTYPGADRIPLLEGDELIDRSFSETLLTRRSFRQFSGAAITKLELARLLRLSNGVSGSMDIYLGQKQYFRTSPSAGALYPVELYAFALNVADLAPGLYHYHPVNHDLETVSLNDFRDRLEWLTREKAMQSASAVLAMTGVSPKTRLKYGERGYRFMLLEAGHIGQNALLAAHALNLGAFTIGGFLDDEMDRLLSVDGVDEVSLYLVAVGSTS